LTSNGAQFCAGPGFASANNCVQVAGTSDDWKTIFQAVAEDFNADGVADLVLTSANGTFFCAGPGIASANNCALVNSQNWRNAAVVAADFNGNGSADLFVRDSSFKIAGGAQTSPDLLTAATNTAFGTTTSFA